jgi:tetratricopeptide (TPR) repeat protein
MNQVAQGRLAEAEPLMRSALDDYRQRGMEQELGRNLSHLGLICRRQGRYDEARQSYTESRRLAETIHDPQGIVVALNGLGTLAYWEGDVDAAQTFFVQCVEQARSLRNLDLLAQYTCNLASVCAELDQGELARQYALESLALRRILQVPMNIGDALNTLGSVLIGLGEYAQARDALVEGVQIRLQSVDVALPFMLETLAELALAEQNPAMTVLFYSSATNLRAQFGTPRPGINQQLYDQTFTAACAQISAAVRAEIWQRGQTMSVDEVCRSAIGNQSPAR